MIKNHSDLKNKIPQNIISNKSSYFPTSLKIIKKIKYPITLKSNRVDLQNTTIFEKKIIVNKGNDTLIYLNHIIDSLYYKTHINILKKYFWM